MKKAFWYGLLAAVACFLAAPPVQAADTASSKPGISQPAAKNKHKKKHKKHKKHKKQNPATS